MQYFSFSLWLNSFSIMPSSFIYVIANGKFSLLHSLGQLWAGDLQWAREQGTSLVGF